MSRCGYSYELEPLVLGRWRGRVASAIRGARGQKLLRDTLAALDDMPDKRLIAEELEYNNEFCTLGAVLHFLGNDPTTFDPEDHDAIGEALDVPPCLVQEIEYLNDEHAPSDPEKRWKYMRDKVAALIKPAKQESPDD